MRYEVLGPVQAKLDDVVVAVGGPQQRRLLALLLSQPGQSVSTQRLVDCLWPDGLAPDGAGRSVMTYVSRLRAALGESSISTVDEGYRLELGDRVDGLAAVRGDARPRPAPRSPVGRSSSTIERWNSGGAAPTATSGTNGGCSRKQIGSTRSARWRRRNAPRPFWRWAITIGQSPSSNGWSPINRCASGPLQLLMQALFATGRHADALRAFQSFRTRLGEETGLDPSGDLVAFERSMASGEPIPDARPGAVVRGYVVHEVLGEGAFGRVFAATQPGTNREVAIKAIRPDLSDSAEFIQRFEAEAQLVARLEHPHIVPLYDYWREPGGAYLVFRLLLGGTALAAMVTTGRSAWHVSAGCRRGRQRVARRAHGRGRALRHQAVERDLRRDRQRVPVRLRHRRHDVDVRSRLESEPRLRGAGTDQTARATRFAPTSSASGACCGSCSPARRRFGDAVQRRWRLPSLAGCIAERIRRRSMPWPRQGDVDRSGREVRVDGRLIVAWRDAVGRPEGVLTPIGFAVEQFAGVVSAACRARPEHRGVVGGESVQGSAPVRRGGRRRFLRSRRRRDRVARRSFDCARRSWWSSGPPAPARARWCTPGSCHCFATTVLRVATMVPGDRPIAALRQALRQVAATDSDTNDPIDAGSKEAAAEGSRDDGARRRSVRGVLDTGRQRRARAFPECASSLPAVSGCAA